jgi:ArsR family metal-binding transcriptional regulator
VDPALARFAGALKFVAGQPNIRVERYNLGQQPRAFVENAQVKSMLGNGGEKRPPRTHCKKCGQPTCTVFSAQVMEGGRGADDCPELTAGNREKLKGYLSGFDFD